MPLYEYIDPATGQVFEEHRAIADRDAPAERVIDGRAVRLERRTVPARLAIVGAHKPTTQAQSVLGGYYREELKHGSRWRSEYTPQQIKETWAHDTGED